jgi:hypothetical protein
MQPDYTAFLDELEKIAIDEVLVQQIGATVGGALGGLRNLPVKGRSKAQEAVDRKIEAARADPTTSEGKMKKLEKAKRKAQIRAEMSYGQLATAPAGLAGIALAKAIGKKMRFSDIGTPEMASALGKELHSKMKRVPVSSAGKAVFIPEGGMLPKILRPLEELFYKNRKMPMTEVRKAIRKGGAVFAPVASPEVLGHELGHAALRRGKWPSRLWTAGRIGGPVAGLLLASHMLGAEDPKDWKVKAAPLMAAASVAPVLAEEALASKKSLEAIKKVAPELSTKVLKGMKGGLGRALGTYGAVLGMSAVLPATAMAISRSVTGKKPQER